MQTFFVVCLVLIWIGAIVGIGFWSVVVWSDDGPRYGAPLAVIAFLLLAGFLTLVAKQDDTAMQSCLRSGRAWAVTGEHTELIYNAALKMAVPQTVTDYGCVERGQ